MTVYRYPLQAPVPGSNDNPDSWGGTEAIDYVRFRQYFMRFDEGTSFSSETLGQTNAQKIYVGGPDAVYINMPPNVQTSYNASYRKVDLGIGGAMLGAAGGTEAFSDMDKLTDALQAAAAGASPEFLNSAVAGAATGISGALGLAGNIGANELQALTKGRIFNPYSEQIFSNMSFRSHNFNFKMFARNQQEGQTIEEIIHYFKRGTHPTFQEGNLIDDPASGAAGRYNDKKGDDDKDWSKITEDWGVLKDSDMWDTQVGQNAKSQRFFKVPNKFEIEFLESETALAGGGFREKWTTVWNSDERLCSDLKVKENFCLPRAIRLTIALKTKVERIISDTQVINLCVPPCNKELFD